MSSTIDRPGRRSRVLALLVVAACNGGSSSTGGADAATNSAQQAVSSGSAACAEATPESCVADAEGFLRADPPKLEDAARVLTEGCNGGEQRACLELALQLQDGRGTKRDVARALSLYDKACDKGYGVGCFNAGLYYKSGRGGAEQRGRAAELLARAVEKYELQCEGDRPTYCSNLGLTQEHGLGTARDTDRARASYVKGCDAKDDEACVNLSLLDLQEDREKDAALRRLDDACKRAHALSCGVLGQLHYKQQFGIPRDRAKATAALETGCKGGAVQACEVLSAIIGLEGSDPTRTAQLEDRACRLGSATSCLGRALALVEGGGADGARAAVPFLELACNIGEPQGCARLGEARLAGAGATLDREQAFVAFGEACKLGDISSCVKLLREGRPLDIPKEDAKDIEDEARRRGLLDK